jgi:DivIVA domain-containing protein
MALDRLSVTRTDFPLSRRGYDRIAVDRHLDEIAREIETLQRPTSIGAATSAQVQSILDAAEAGAAEIERRAWEEAGRVQDAADQALARAREQVAALQAASHALRERLDSLLAEVDALEGTLVETASPTAPVPQDTVSFDPILEDEQPQPAVEAPTQVHAVAPAPPQLPQREGRFGRAPSESDRRTGWFSQGPPAWTGATTATPAASTQEARESARLVALNMADGGQPREAADRYLSQLFEPAERQALLDEIYGGRQGG